jgi:hypothetical protein
VNSLMTVREKEGQSLGTVEHSIRSTPNESAGDATSIAPPTSFAAETERYARNTRWNYLVKTGCNGN